MIFYSHSKEDASGNVIGSKDLRTHTCGVKQNALFNFNENVEFELGKDELKHLISLAAGLHDLGKYTTYFQNYLLKKKPINNRLKQHARLGAFTAFNLLENETEKKALLLFYLIFLHHSCLINFSEISLKLGLELEDLINTQKENLKPQSGIIEDETGLKNVADYIYYPEEKKIRRGYKKWLKKEVSIQDYFLINYLFSLLIEGDKLDASNTQPYHLKPIPYDMVDKRFGVVSLSDVNVKELSDNELRNYCRAVVTSHIAEDDILEHYIFTLTAPTGIGKTMTALDFSLKLKEKIKKNSGEESRIIYALPFINIIEQALDEYKKTLKNHNIRILGHYQYADVFGEDKKGDDESEEQNYNQKLMSLDTWQADIVITSFVQFFQTLISNRNKLLKKFNHLAGSIIILDEVQTLRLDQMPLLGVTLFYLSKFLRARIILMTATRPKIFELAEQELLLEQGESINPLELLTNYEEVFARFKRTAIFPVLRKFNDPENVAFEFTSSLFAEKWAAHLSCLIVCNTVSFSIELFNKIQDYLKEYNLSNRVYYLSTNIIPTQRLDRIERIKKDLENKLAPILIATQVVEAGVDLDFDMGFRDIGPIDSIVQVAGRINRNNHPQKIHSPLYILDFNSKQTIQVYGRLAYLQAKKALEQQDCFYEEEYLKLIEGYFEGIADKSSFDKSRQFFKSMQTLNYDNENKETCPVSDFRIIEESDLYATVFLELDESVAEIRDKFLQKITGEISTEEFNQHWKLRFQQHIISIPRYLCDCLDPINEYEKNILVVPMNEIGDTYLEDTGFNREKKEANRSFTF